MNLLFQAPAVMLSQLASNWIELAGEWKMQRWDLHVGGTEPVGAG